MARAIDCKTCLHEKVCALWWGHERQDASCFCQDGCDYFAPTLTPPNEWVSVEDAVPDPGERVLATDGIFVGEAYRTSANSWYRNTGFPWRDCLQSVVTHWMPLPKSPKEDE